MNQYICVFNHTSTFTVIATVIINHNSPNSGYSDPKMGNIYEKYDFIKYS